MIFTFFNLEYMGLHNHVGISMSSYFMFWLCINCKSALMAQLVFVKNAESGKAVVSKFTFPYRLK